MTNKPFIVGIGGTTREGSSAERALRAALEHIERQGGRVQAFCANELPREIFDPSNPGRSESARNLVEALRQCDGVIIATPSYHSGISGLIKNALDFIEDLRSDSRVYLQDRAVGSIVCADGPQAMGATLAALRAIAHALRAWPTPYGATINTRNRPFGGEGQAADPSVIQACEMVADEVLKLASTFRAARFAPA